MFCRSYDGQQKAEAGMAMWEPVNQVRNVWQRGRGSAEQAACQALQTEPPDAWDILGEKDPMIGENCLWFQGHRLPMECQV